MTELLMKVFRKKEYWKRKTQEAHDKLIAAEYHYKKAARLHEKCADLHFEFKLARVEFEKAWQKFQEARGY